MNVQHTIDNCPADQVEELAQAAFDQLTDDQKISIIMKWGREDEIMAGELMAQLDDIVTDEADLGVPGTYFEANAEYDCGDGDIE